MTGDSATTGGADGALLRRYRRLMLSYPRHYRRYRGEEMLAALLDATPPGRDRPTWREGVGLVVGGLRRRLRVRPGPATKLAAVLAAAICGVLVAAGGAWLGWRTAAPLPDSAQVARIASAVPLSPAKPAIRHDYIFGSPAGEGSPGLTGLAEYDSGGVIYVYNSSPVGRPGPSALAAEVADRLRADGWRVDGATFDGKWTTSVVAYKGGTHVVFFDVSGFAKLRIDRAEPAAVPVLTVVGLIVGALMGWLLAGWVSRRAATQPVAVKVAVILLSTVSFAAFTPACFYGWIPVVRGYVEEGQGGALWGGLVFIGVRPLAGIGAVAALIVVALAALPQLGRGPATAIHS